jgi:hypothetical protein
VPAVEEAGVLLLAEVGVLEFTLEIVDIEIVLNPF